MSAKIQKLVLVADSNDPAWVDWIDNFVTRDEAISAVKGYCLGPGCKFRVIEDDKEVFAWSHGEP